MATGGVGISDTRHHGSPEHNALIESRCVLITSISRSPKEIADILVPLRVLSQNDKADINSDGLNDAEKARKIVEILTDEVKLDPSFYHILIANLTKNQPWMKSCLEKVSENFDNAKHAEPTCSHSEIDSENVCTVPKQPVGLYTHLSETEPLIVPSEKFDEEKLEKLTADIKKNFASLAACVADALIEGGVTPRSLIFYLQELEAVESDKIKAKSILYFDENFIKTAKKDCSVVYDVFDMIRDYYSWVNYGLLENIIDTYLDRNEVIRKKRRLYENQYKTYCKRRVCKIPRNRFMVFSSRCQGTELVFKIDEKWDEIRMERIETIRDRINMVFKFNYHTLSLKTVRNGCVEVTFEIPKHVADVVLPLTEEQVQILKQHSITLIVRKPPENRSTETATKGAAPVKRVGTPISSSASGASQVGNRRGPPSNRVALQELMRRYNLIDEQLNSKITNCDFLYLATYFDDVEIYSNAMELASAEQADVKRLYHSEGTRAAMMKCLKIWKQHNPSQATYRALLDIVLRLGKGDTADKICRQLTQHLTRER